MGFFRLFLRVIILGGGGVLNQLQFSITETLTVIAQAKVYCNTTAEVVKVNSTMWDVNQTLLCPNPSLVTRFHCKQRGKPEVKYSAPE